MVQLTPSNGWTWTLEEIDAVSRALGLRVNVTITGGPETLEFTS
jgi:hypothetical protein